MIASRLLLLKGFLTTILVTVRSPFSSVVTITITGYRSFLTACS